MPVNLAPDDLSKIIAELENGHCVGLPTETVYGLAADATNGEAVARIFEMKGRPKFNPLIAHVANVTMAREHGVFNDAADALTKAFWPGPLTIVLPLNKQSNIHPLVSAGLQTIGLRNPIGPAQTIIEAFGKPLAAPSANRSGRISPTSSNHVCDEFEDTDLMVVDGPHCDVGIESTILKIEDNRVIILRPGSITEDMIAEVIDNKVEHYSGDEIKAPGMMKSHYAPDAKLLMNQTEIPSGSVVLAFGDSTHSNDAGHLFNLSKESNLREAASNLYKGMKLLDQTETDIIYVNPIPNEGLGIAINDRLSRAAAPKPSSNSNE